MYICYQQFPLIISNLSNLSCLFYGCAIPLLKPARLMCRWQQARPEVEGITSREFGVLMQEFSGKKRLTGVNRYSHQSPGVVVSLIRIRTSSQFRAAFTFPRNSENLIGKVSRKLSGLLRVISKSCRNCQEGFSSAFWLIITPERGRSLSWTLYLIIWIGKDWLNVFARFRIYV